MLPGARPEQALHRCVDLASPFGTIRVLKVTAPDTREFVLELGDSGQQRLRWTLKAISGGTELCVTRQAPVSWLTTMVQRGTAADLELERKLDLLPHILNLRIVVLGGGTGLYTTLVSLRDRTSSLTAVVRELSPANDRGGKDQHGFLPPDDASLCLVALAPSLQENLVLRELLGHQTHGGPCAATHFRQVFFDALTEIRQSPRAAVDEAGRLLATKGRIVLALNTDSSANGTYLSAAALDVLQEADLVVVAPGDTERDILPPLTIPGMVQALYASPALKIIVTRIMTREGTGHQGSTSGDLESVSRVAPHLFDVVVANTPTFSESQLAEYAAVGAHPIVPDAARTARYAKRVVTEKLAASGNLARHDPARLGECVIEIASSGLLGSSYALK
jgi:2-phospho-L-lactate transferase/gluconeogenesis factor (CofD/UPF0052 family)